MRPTLTCFVCPCCAPAPFHRTTMDASVIHRFSPASGRRTPTDRQMVINDNRGSVISPLRISKNHPNHATSPPPPTSSNNGLKAPEAKPPARRGSYSFKHVLNHNLVSKSPFKSQIPSPVPKGKAPATRDSPSINMVRKVSGEKRPRPESFIQQAEAENARTVTEMVAKRRRSRAFQGLVEKEPVTKSPFRQVLRPSAEENKAVPVPNVPGIRYDAEDDSFTTSGDSDSEGTDLGFRRT